MLDQKPKPIQPPDDEIGDAANEYLAEQYDNEIQELYREAQEQARLKHEEGQHGHDEHHAYPN